MALLFMEGFDHYADLDDFQQKGGWNSQSTVNFVSGVSGNPGGRDGVGRALQIFATNQEIVHSFPASSATVVVGFAIYHVGAPTSTDMMILRYQDTEKIVLRWVGSELAIDRGSTNLAITSGLGLSTGVWYYIEVKVFMDNSTGTYDVWVNGVNELSGTGVDTLNGATATCDTIWLQGHTAIDHCVDDLYILDDTGTDATDRLNQPYIETLFPDGNGNRNNFTASPAVSNYLNVDDAAAPDDDTTYNHTTTSGHDELYTFGNLSGTVDTVYGVKVDMCMKKVGSGERTCRALARSSATEATGNSQGTVEGNYKNIHHIFENDPNGGGNWTETTVNAAEFGVEVVT